MHTNRETQRDLASPFNVNFSKPVTRAEHRAKPPVLTPKPAETCCKIEETDTDIGSHKTDRTLEQRPAGLQGPVQATARTGQGAKPEKEEPSSQSGKVHSQIGFADPAQFQIDLERTTTGLQDRPTHQEDSKPFSTASAAEAAKVECGLPHYVSRDPDKLPGCMLLLSESEITCVAELKQCATSIDAKAIMQSQSPFKDAACKTWAAWKRNLLCFIVTFSAILSLMFGYQSAWMQSTAVIFHISMWCDAEPILKLGFKPEWKRKKPSKHVTSTFEPVYTQQGGWDVF